VVTTSGAVVGYARLSTADQAKGLTLEQQVSRLRDAGATEVLIDLLSGTTTARPRYRELLRRIGEGAVAKVIATRWDRICRSASETCRMVDLLTAEGAPELLLLDDPQDLSTIGGRAQLRMLGVFAQMEAERIRERSAAGKAHRKAKGLSDVAPFGMELCGGMLRPDRRPFLSELTTRRELTRADLLLEAFTISSREGSMHAPWRHLGETYGIWLDRTGMRRLLLNPALRGAKVGKRDKARATWADVVEGAGGEPLIDPEEHQRYEAFIRGQMARRSAPDKRLRHVLAGKVLCAHCNGLMTRGTVTRSPHGRWFCHRQDCSWAIPRERRNAVMEPVLLEAVLLAMAEQAPAVAAAMERQAQRADESVATAPEVQKLQAKRQRYLALLAEGDPVQPVIDALDQQIAALLAAGPADGGGHLLRLRESMLRRERITQVLSGAGTFASTGEAAVAAALEQSWRQQASWAAAGGEGGIGPGIWDEIRELVRVAVVRERRLARLELNL
jgi:hypothetical protein